MTAPETALVAESASFAETRPGKGRKAEETRTRILEAALLVFRERGFDKATMREIAAQAGVATGAAYYYFDSKEALVMAFYERSQREMHATIEAALDRAPTLEARLRAIISTKFTCFAPNRALLGALTAHTDPEHPISPFSAETAAIRLEDIASFERAVAESRVKLPPTVAPYLGRLLWMYQMGLILFWVYDRSENQARTALLFDKTLGMLLVALRLASFPLLRPLHKMAGELLAVIYNEQMSPTAWPRSASAPPVPSALSDPESPASDRSHPWPLPRS